MVVDPSVSIEKLNSFRHTVYLTRCWGCSLGILGIRYDVISDSGLGFSSYFLTCVHLSLLMSSDLSCLTVLLLKDRAAAECMIFVYNFIHCKVYTLYCGNTSNSTYYVTHLADVNLKSSKWTSWPYTSYIQRLSHYSLFIEKLAVCINKQVYLINLPLSVCPSCRSKQFFYLVTLTINQCDCVVTVTQLSLGDKRWAVWGGWMFCKRSRLFSKQVLL